MFLFFSRKQHISATTLSQILSAINNWVFQSKIIFNPNLTLIKPLVVSGFFINFEGYSTMECATNAR